MSGVTAAIEGFEYQARVSVWIALDLMFRANICNSITLEPINKEDVDATILPNPISIQIKTRSKPWTAANFRDLLTHGSQSDNIATVTNKQARTPPLVQLKQRPLDRYILITSAQLNDSTLQTLAIDAVDQQCSNPALPELASSAAMQHGLEPQLLATRIGIIEQLTDELVRNRAKQLLATYCHVPSDSIEECFELLFADAWTRMTAVPPLPWTRTDIEARITSDSIRGRLALSAEVQSLIVTDLLDRCREHAKKTSAILLIGPPGTGKTAVATSLIESLQLESNPFSIVSDPDWSAVDQRMKNPGRFAFFFDDPWGKYKSESGREGWATELLRRISHASTDHKFVVTSPNTTSSAALTAAERAKLEPYIVQVSGESYSKSERMQIAQKRLKHQNTWHRQWLDDHTDLLVKSTGNLLVIVEFVDQLSSIQEIGDAEFAILIARAQHEKLTERLATELRAQGEAVVLGGFLLWLLLSKRSTATESELATLGLTLRTQHSIDISYSGAWSWLTGRRTLIERQLGFAMHPVFLKGLELAWRAPSFIDAVTTTHSRLIEHLIASGAHQQALAFYDSIDSDQHPSLSQTTRQNLEHKLISDAVNATSERDFRAAFYGFETVQLQNTESAGRLIIALNVRLTKRPRGFIYSDVWMKPNWSPAELNSIQQSTDAALIMANFIKWILPSSSHEHSNYAALPSFVKSLNWGLGDEFVTALKSAFDNLPNYNADVLVRGALSEGVPFETVFELCLGTIRSLESKYDKVPWGEDVLDSMDEEQIYYEIDNDIFGPQRGLFAAVETKHSTSGWRWIPEHTSKNRLIEDWARIVASREDIDHEELDALLNLADAEGKIKSTWNHFGSRFLPDSIVLSWIKRLTLLSAARLVPLFFSVLQRSDEPKFIDEIRAELANSSKLRRAEVAFSMADVRWPMREDTPLEEIGLSNAELRSLLEAIASIAPHNAEQTFMFSAPTIELLNAVLNGSSAVWAAQALLLLSRSGHAPDSGRGDLVENSEASVRMLAAGAHFLTPVGRSIAFALLCDKDRKCRELGIALLAPAADAKERDSILALHKDVCGNVRRKVAETIGDCRWHGCEAILQTLLRDEWDTAMYDGHNDYSAEHPVRDAASCSQEKLSDL